jgi:hypothetical protein
MNQTSTIKFRILLILAFVSFTSAEIDIWGPSQLKNLYKTKTSQYSIANFGTVPYGHTIIGTVKKAVPFDGCSPLKSIQNTNEEGALILMVVRGSCHFAEKVINAQKIGASMVVIVDNHDEDVHSVMPVERGRNTLNKVDLLYFS